MESLTSRARRELGLPPSATSIPTADMAGGTTHQLRYLGNSHYQLIAIDRNGTEPSLYLDDADGLTSQLGLRYVTRDPDRPRTRVIRQAELGETSPYRYTQRVARDDVTETVRRMGSRWRPATQALHDVATGRETLLTGQTIERSRPFRDFADAMLGQLFIEGASSGAQHVPRSPETIGNTAELLVRNEKYLPKLYQDLEQATDSITISQFNWEPDGSGRRVIDILKHKASAAGGGLDVRVMVDAYGFRERGFAEARAIQDELEAAGVKVQRSWPFLPRQGWEHRKLITIDDRITYAGGLGFGAKYDSWTDLMVRMEGPAGAVAGAHGLTTWRDLAGPLDARGAARLRGIDGILHGSSLVRRMGPERLGLDAGAAITLLENRPGIDLAATESFIRDARAATDQLWVTSTYLTTPNAAKELIAASKAGADVKLVVTGLGAGNDTGNIKFARTFYREMMDAGVEIFERQDGVMHAKSYLSVGRNGTVTTAGSMNMSENSMKRAREVMARIVDKDFADSYRAFHTELRDACRQVQYADLDGFGLRALTVARKLLRLKS